MDITDRDEMTNIIRDVWVEFNKLKPGVKWRIDIDNQRFPMLSINFNDKERERHSDKNYRRSKWGKPKYNPNEDDSWDEDFESFCERLKDFNFTYNFNLELSTKLNIMGLKEFLQTHGLYKNK